MGGFRHCQAVLGLLALRRPINLHQIKEIAFFIIFPFLSGNIKRFP